jgi:ankyrin repeat protein/Tol biopolymer transport system component
LVVALTIGGAAVAAEIHEAAQTGNLDRVKALLAEDSRLANALDDSGRTPLHWAARTTHLEIAKLLVAHGADVTIRDVNQVLPLHSAAYRGADAFVAFMIAEGADVDAKAITGATPLHFAVQAGHVRTVDLLVSHDAGLEVTDGLGNSPLLLASSYGLAEIVETLLARGADVNRPNSRGDTPLTVAYREDHEQIVELLIDHGADKTHLKEFRLPEGAYLGQEPPGTTPVLFAPRIVSTERAQLNAVFSPDGKEFYFTQRRPGGSSIMEMRMQESRWSRPTTASFSGRHADVDHFMTRDGRKMYFCSNRALVEGTEPTQRHVDIWVSTRSGEDWEAPRHLGPDVNSTGDDYYPTLADDGTLYLSSNREGGRGESDIYRVPSIDGEFRSPENLGAAINTRFTEFDPFVSPDHGYLIFASGRPGGYGSSDLYISFRAPDGSWTPARNMGPEINSESTDFTPMITPDGKYLFLTSGRGGGSDLYWVDAQFIEDLRPKLGTLSGAYFGQEPPGRVPEVFAPVLLSRTKPQWAFCAEFAPDHTEFYFSREAPDLQIDQVMWMRRIGDRWTDPEPAPFNSPHSSNDSRISPDGRRLYFRSRRPLPGDEHTDGQLLLWSVPRSGHGWGEPEPVLFGGSPGRTSHVGVAANGTLYFSYRSAGEAGDADVHKAPPESDSHAEPVNLGSGINSPYSEGDVFVAPDESFLVVSVWDHPDNHGESDLHISFRMRDGSWSALKNVGEPINTGANENCPALSPDGKYFFYAAVDTQGDRPTIVTYWVDAKILETYRPAP